MAQPELKITPPTGVGNANIARGFIELARQCNDYVTPNNLQQNPDLASQLGKPLSLSNLMSSSDQDPNKPRPPAGERTYGARQYTADTLTVDNNLKTIYSASYLSNTPQMISESFPLTSISVIKAEDRGWFWSNDKAEVAFAKMTPTTGSPAIGIGFRNDNNPPNNIDDTVTFYNPAFYSENTSAGKTYITIQGFALTKEPQKNRSGQIIAHNLMTYVYDQADQLVEVQIHNPITKQTMIINKPDLIKGFFTNENDSGLRIAKPAKGVKIASLSLQGLKLDINPTPTPSTEQPISTPATLSPTPPSTPEATATPKAITATEIGLKSPALKTAFAGAENTVTREKDGYTVESFYYGGEDGTKKVDAKYTIDTTSWNANPDIKDDLTRPLEVEAVRLDKDGQEVKVKLLWMGEKIGWFEELDMAKSDMTALAKTKTLTPEDFANNVYVDLKEPGAHLALLMSARAYYAENGAPFNQETLDRMKKQGQHTLLFKHAPVAETDTDPTNDLDNDLVWGTLKNRGEGDVKTMTYENQPIKFVMSFRTPDGWKFIIADANNPDDINDFLLLVGTPFDTGPIDLSIESNAARYAPAFSTKKPILFPYIIFYANDPYRKLYPEVDKNLKRPGNDPGQLPFPAYLDENGEPQFKFIDGYEEGDTEAKNDEKGLFERQIAYWDAKNNKIYTPLPPEAQLLDYSFYTGELK